MLGFKDVLYNTGNVVSYTSSGSAIPGATLNGLNGAASFKMEGGNLYVDHDNNNVVGTINFSSCALQIYSGTIHIKVYEGSGSPAQGTCDLLNVTSGNCYIDNSNNVNDANDAGIFLSTAALPRGTVVPTGQSSACIQVGSGYSITGNFTGINSLAINDGSGHSWLIGIMGRQFIVKTTF